MNEFFKAIQGFMIDYLPKQKCLSQNTIRSYRFALNLLVLFMREKKQLPIQKINFNTINKNTILEFLEWLEAERGCSATSRNQRLAALCSFFNYAGMVDCVNVSSSFAVSQIPRKREPGRVVDFLSEKALEELLKTPNLNDRLGLRNGFFLILMYDTAARCDELLHLRICDIQADTKHPSAYLTGKGKKTRLVPLMPKTVEHYKKYLKEFHPNSNSKDTDLVFYTIIHNKRCEMSPDTASTFMKKYAKLAKDCCPEIPDRVHLHMLRHTRAIHLYRKGMPLELVSQFLGHSSLDTSKIYAFADVEMKRTAILKADTILESIDISKSPIWKDNDDMILRLSGLK